MIINLTIHAATADQKAAGVVDLHADVQAVLRGLLTFETLPEARDILDRAEAIAELAITNRLGPEDDLEDPIPSAAMIGGALWLMAPLAAALRRRGIEPLFAFSVRETEEQAQPDGTVKKVSVFRHAGFVPAV